MYCYTHRTYYTGHCHHCCHCCGHVHMPVPQYWCNTCQRYTHTLHNHYHWIQPFPVRPVIICGPQQRDQNTIRVLAG